MKKKKYLTGAFFLLSMLLSYGLFVSAGEGQSIKVRRKAAINRTTASEKTDVLFAAMDNSVSIAIPGYSNHQMRLEITGGTVRDQDSVFMVKPDFSVKEVNIRIYSKLNGEFLTEKKFRVFPIPKPVVFFGTKSAGLISTEEIAAVSQLRVGSRFAYNQDFDFDKFRYTITSYEFVLSPVKGSAYFEKVLGSGITSGVRNKLNTAVPGDLIVISDLNALGPAGNVIIPGSTLTVQ
jgi:hypothetical protein